MLAVREVAREEQESNELADHGVLLQHCDSQAQEAGHSSAGSSPSISANV